MIPRLRITADDVGALPCIDTAVENLIRLNVINSVSVFINGTSDISWINKYTSTLSIGLHLTFSYGHPISLINDPHLVGTDGSFLFPIKPIPSTSESIKKSIDEYLNQISCCDRGQVKIECISQIDAFIKAFGRIPDFVNLHHDLDRCDTIRCVLSELLPNLPTRQIKLNDPRRNYGYFYQFLDASDSYNIHLEVIRLLLSSGYEFIKRSTINETEVVFHPAYDSDELSEFSTYNTMRYREYQILSSDVIKKLIDELSDNIV